MHWRESLQNIVFRHILMRTLTLSNSARQDERKAAWPLTSVHAGVHSWVPLSVYINSLKKQKMVSFWINVGVDSQQSWSGSRSYFRVIVHLNIFYCSFHFGTETTDQLSQQRLSVLILFSDVLHKSRDCRTRSIGRIAFIWGLFRGNNVIFFWQFSLPSSFSLSPESLSIYINQNIFTQSPPPLQQI